MATINGTTSNDFLDGSLEADIISGLIGDDIIRGFDGNDNINSNEGNDIINGNAGNDNVQGGQGNDIVRGGQGNDQVFGNLGNDTLFGDLGADTLTGGEGNDTFFLRNNAGTDIFVDFADGVDRLGLSSGLSFNDLLISQGTGANANNTIITDNITGELLAILQGVNSTTITLDDFTTGDFDENFYLVRNFDVAYALFKGQINSALDHYNQAGKAEGRMGTPPRPSTFNIEFDYRFDTNGFLADPARKATLEAAAKVWESVIQDEFPDIPAGTAFFVENPQTGQIDRIVLDKPIDDLLIFVGAKPFTGEISEAGGVTNGEAAGFEDANGFSYLFLNRIEGDNYEPYAGSISFNTLVTYQVDSTPFILSDNPPGNFGYGLFSTAEHEIGHALGIGLGGTFEKRSNENIFDGPNVRAVNGGNPIPFDGEGHPQFNFVSSKGVPAFLGGSENLRSLIPTEVDLAILADIGYQIAGGF
ncbi:hypothetical protein [Argonema antarcticum]|uniref:hypothetical protein n=1 Tax=Argonema antarcticum TaxID=2942763 RepID=UPI002011B224|nr:hypothetical protein [Argonema antarcticum]MCL1471942.1 hypothetical protein [Argonema antarcticum A004/B2]